MSWRVANSPETLRYRIDARFPGRGVAADGVRALPRLDAPVVAVLPGPTRVTVTCFLSTLFIDHPDAWLPDVNEC
ncbi:hypothetical protein SAMN04487983_1002278 [Streptomyces sp. yr375]|uniref:hypothetical protein n=1 Tax=Streptomyces sp. yr375 TaxID=1761906 RepID=UPI0008C2F1E3|nr:hypothetical protein [Streptomyces sp. yr375]SEP96035.1 hypothetical protein SAMN04487983_1002278 [Streptomyces sp. yr375]